MKALTARALILGIVLSIVVTILHSYTNVLAHENAIAIRESGGWPWDGNVSPNSLGLVAANLFFAMGLAAINRILPKKQRLSSGEMIFVLACIIMAPVLTGQAGPAGKRWWSGPTHMYGWTMRYETWEKYGIGLYYPKDPSSQIEAMKMGGAVPDWDLWMTSIINQIIFFSFLRLFLLFGTAIIQEMYIDIENLAFPSATLTKSALDLVAPQEAEEDKGLLDRMGRKFKKLFLIGFVVYLIYHFIWNIGTYYPPYAEVPPQLSYDFTKYNWIYGPLYITVDLQYFPVLFIIPINAVISTWIFQILLYMIIPPILVATGDLPEAKIGQSAGYRHDQLISQGRGVAATHLTLGYYPFYMGVIYGLCFVPLYFQRHFIINSIRRAIRGDKGAWMSMRALWGGWAITGLATIAMFIYLTGAPIYYTITFMIVLGGMYMGIARMAAGAGVEYMIGTHGGWAGTAGYWMTYVSMYHTGMVKDSPDTYNAAVLSNGLLGGSNMGLRLSNPMPYYLDIFKLGQLSNSDKKGLTVGMIIGTILPIVVGIPVTIWLIYTFGWNRAAVYNTSRWFHDSAYLVRYLRDARPTGTIEEWRPWSHIIGMVTGIIVVAGLALGTRRFVPLSYITPYAFHLVFSAGMVFWFAAIIVTIIRLVILRVGGTRMYERTVYPIVLGMIMCQGFLWVIQVIVWTLRGAGYVWW